MSDATPARWSPDRRVVPGRHGELGNTVAERAPAISKPAFSMPAA
ncbi:hypothetical protein [Streptomyces neyagawaensis]|nr:hypothetical protein [Streptomyces neyagawaensis]MDE1688260.1 hypothetical protein [Streptomyces neyagawaensis]